MNDLKRMNIKELEDLCENMREQIIEVVGKNGGHLGPNLGVVELSIALHYVYNSPEDKIVWDVGHQSYVHKILTGRKDKFHTIRKKGGLGPFTDPNESVHDQFISGHAGNSLSAATGLAMANPDKDVIVIIGDAAFANGTTLEALNDINGKIKNLTIIINDNEMSIGENVGAISEVFNKVINSHFYLKLRKDVRKLLSRYHITKPIVKPTERLEQSLRSIVTPGGFFNILGYDYIGPMDGHNLEKLIKIFGENSRERTRVIHLKTKKGKGYCHAELDPESYHGVGPFNKETGESLSKSRIYSDVFGDKMLEMLEKDEKVLAISAGMIKGTGLKKAKKQYKDRVLDTGMTEGHTITMAAALAKEGIKPYVAIYSTFLQRAYSHLIHDVAILKLPVRMILDRAGFVADDGKTHQGIFDIAYLLTIPNIDIAAPTSEEELENILDFSLNIEKPLAIRIPKDTPYSYKFSNYEYGKWNKVREGNKYMIIACGVMFSEVMKIEKEIGELLDAAIVSAAWIRPFDIEFIKKEFPKFKKVIILEDGIEKSGFGTEILEYVNDLDIDTKIIRKGIKQKFLPHAKRSELLEEEKLTGKSLLDDILMKVRD